MYQIRIKGPGYYFSMVGTLGEAMQELYRKARRLGVDDWQLVRTWNGTAITERARRLPLP